MRAVSETPVTGVTKHSAVRAQKWVSQSWAGVLGRSGHTLFRGADLVSAKLAPETTSEIHG
jgi:hypothetical protein